METLDKGKLICSVCGVREGDVRVNPYLEDIEQKLVEEIICDECYEKLCDDI